MEQPYSFKCPRAVEGVVESDGSRCTGTTGNTNYYIYYTSYKTIITFRTSNNRAALVRLLFYFAVLTDSFRERTDSEVAHEHPVMASTIQTWLVRNYPVSFVIMLEIVVATSCICD